MDTKKDGFHKLDYLVNQVTPRKPESLMYQGYTCTRIVLSI